MSNLIKLTSLQTDQLNAVSRLSHLIAELRAIVYGVSVLPYKAKTHHNYLDTHFRENVDAMKENCTPYLLKCLGLAEFEEEYAEALSTLEAIANKEGGTDA